MASEWHVRYFETAMPGFIPGKTRLLVLQYVYGIINNDIIILGGSGGIIAG